MVEFKNVTKAYGSILALEDITLNISQGEFVFIIGPSGAGKTTLLKLLIAQIKPTKGELFVGDKALHKFKSKDIPLYRQKVGMVFQDYKLLPERTIAENVEVALAIKKIPSKEWKPRVNKVLELVGLKDRGDLFPSQLSGGELQRASLARALVINPDVILADEPTGNLDWQTADAIMDLLVKINHEGKTLIVTSHNKSIVEKIGKRVVEIEKGAIVSDTILKKHKKD